MARIGCPLPDYDAVDNQGNAVFWIETPDAYLGEHADRRDAAVGQARELEMRATYTNFAVALSLLDAWNLPGLPNGTISAEGFAELPLEIIAWVIGAVLPDFNKCFIVPKG